MKRLICIVLLACASVCGAQAQSDVRVDVDRFGDALDHWRKAHEKASYERYGTDEYRAIADNMLAYQNEDGGWPKNLDWLAKLDPDSVKASLKPRHRLSTLDNSNVYTQIEYLATVYTLTSDRKYADSAERGMEYILSTQYPDGGWRGWDADAITYNDGVMAGVLSAWLDILDRRACYAWVDDAMRGRIEASWRRALQCVLDTQWKQAGERTAWAQQYDHQSLLPVKARAYELPGLVALESADLAMLLMRIEDPSAEVVEAVEGVVRWFDRSKIEGKRVETFELPVEERTDPKLKKDRRLVDDPEGEALWARYYDLESNRPFFSNRDGSKVYDLKEVAQERRAGYSWYGTWGKKVLKRYKAWRKELDAR